jgi:hypothetical protein
MHRPVRPVTLDEHRSIILVPRTEPQRTSIGDLTRTIAASSWPPLTSKYMPGTRMDRCGYQGCSGTGGIGPQKRQRMHPGRQSAVPAVQSNFRRYWPLAALPNATTSENRGNADPGKVFHGTLG